MAEFKFEQEISKDIFFKKYALHGEHTVEEVLQGVATRVAMAEADDAREYWQKRFYDIMIGGEFMPAGRVLANARPDSKMNMYMNCFVLPIGDSMEAIYTALKQDALVGKAGGGVGFNISALRPKGAKISKGGESSGPMSFLEIFDASAKAIHTGGFRRAAHLAIMNIDHPDIEEFITYKHGDANKRLTQFNISVGITDKFMECVKKDADWDLQFEGKIYKTVKARYLYNLIADNMYQHNEPGVFFLDTVNADNNGWYMYDIEAPNPCVTGDTLILTDKGNIRIDSVVGQETNVWNGHEYSEVTPKITAYDQDIIDIVFSNGASLSCTPYHKFVLKNSSRIEAKDLKVGDTLSKWTFPVIAGDKELINAYTQGVFSGDGYSQIDRNRQGITLYNEKKDLVSYLNYKLLNVQKDQNNNAEEEKIYLDVTGYVDKDKNFVPDCAYTVASRLNWLAGIIDTDGTNNSSCGSIAIASANYNFLSLIQNMLMTLGAHSTVSLTRDKKTALMPDGHGGKKEYSVKKEYRLVISASNVKVLSTIGLVTHRIKLFANPDRDASRFIKIKNISKRNIKEQKVYCFNEPKNHTGIFNGVMTAQCGEQPLPVNGSCCLGSMKLSAFVNNSFTDNATFDGLRFIDSVRVAVRMLDDVLDTSEYPIPEVTEQVKRERRIGLGMTAIADAMAMLGYVYGSEESFTFINNIGKMLCDTSYRASIELAKEKGVFPTFDPHMLCNGFVSKLPADIKRDIEIYGLRNMALNCIAPTGCLVPESIVNTSEGLLTLEEMMPNYKTLPEGFWLKSDLLKTINEKDEYKAVANIFNNGYMPTKRIITKSGIYLEGTPDHKFRVLYAGEYIWKKMEDITINDTIIYKIGGYAKNSNKELLLPSYVVHPNEKPITLPKELTEELAFFLGVYNADGSTHKKGIRINLNTLTDEPAIIKKTIQDIFGWHAQIIDNGRNCSSVYISSQRLLKYLDLNGLIKNKSLDIVIPRAVRESSKKAILAYIDGYFFGDGSKTKNSRYIDTYSEKNSQQLAIILRSVGINSAIQLFDKSKDVNSYSDNICYRVHFKKYGSIGNTTSWKYVKKEVVTTVNKLKDFGNNLLFDTVVSIVDGFNFTMDVEVPDGRTYIANSYISHNTTSLSLGNNCSSGVEPIFALEYTRNVTQADGTFKSQTVYDEAWLKYQWSIGDVVSIIPDYFITADKISLEASVQMQAILQKYIDASISKTITLPDTFTKDEYRSLLFNAWERGLKGFTVYNTNGSLAPILSKKTPEHQELRYSKKRPELVPCDIHELTVNRQKMVVLVGKDADDGTLYEVFLTADNSGVIQLQKAKHGMIRKTCTGRYDLLVDGKIALENITGVFDDDYASMCRLLSMSMRHKIPLQFIIDQLNKTKRFDTFAKTMARVLKTYIVDGEKVLSKSHAVCPECGSELTFKEGCLTCNQCGWSKC